MTPWERRTVPGGIAVATLFDGASFDPILKKVDYRDLVDLVMHGGLPADACRQVGVSPATFHRWERSYGFMSRQEAKTFGKLQAENRQLKRLLAEAELEKAALRELAESNF